MIRAASRSTSAEDDDVSTVEGTEMEDEWPDVIGEAGDLPM